jgi:hypothetical protein
MSWRYCRSCRRERENERSRIENRRVDSEASEPRRASAAVAPRSRAEQTPPPAPAFDDILRRVRNSILAHGYLRTFLVWPLSRAFHALPVPERARSLEFMMRCRNTFLAFARYKRTTSVRYILAYSIM